MVINEFIILIVCMFAGSTLTQSIKGVYKYRREHPGPNQEGYIPWYKSPADPDLRTNAWLAAFAVILFLAALIASFILSGTLLNKTALLLIIELVVMCGFYWLLPPLLSLLARFLP